MPATQRVQLRGAFGGKPIIPTTQLRIPISVGERSVEIDAFVVEPLAVELLIGRPTLGDELGVVMDLRDNTYCAHGPPAWQAAEPILVHQPLGRHTNPSRVRVKKYGLRAVNEVELRPLHDATVEVSVVDEDGSVVPASFMGITSRLEGMAPHGAALPNILLKTGGAQSTWLHVRSFAGSGKIQKDSIVGVITPVDLAENDVHPFTITEEFEESPRKLTPEEEVHLRVVIDTDREQQRENGERGRVESSV